MSRISRKNQVTLPIRVLQEAGLRSGEDVTIEPVGDGEVRIRRGTTRFDDAFGG